ncbi:hypothetical protein KPL70_003492 [Citrus sinensis]|nr:hypothetical protein KPL70_003492 [Citrus sinensis]
MGSLQHLYEVTEKLDNLTLFCLFVNYEPVNFQKVVQDEKLRKVMDEEIKSIVKNDTWELTTLPKCHKAIGVKWVYKMKKNTKGEIENYKARLVAKNYRLNVGIDYDEKWKIFKIDVKSAFLNGFLEEEVYKEQPLGYMLKEHEDKVLRLKKPVCRLKQASRARNSRIDKYFQENGFTKCLYENALYVKGKDKDILIICLYVDDFTRSNPTLFQEFKRVVIKEFEIIDIRLKAYYLNVDVKQKKEGTFISQESYEEEILKKFKMHDCNAVSTQMKCGVKLSNYDKIKGVGPMFFKILV